MFSSCTSDRLLSVEPRFEDEEDVEEDEDTEDVDDDDDDDDDDSAVIPVLVIDGLDSPSDMLDASLNVRDNSADGTDELKLSSIDDFALLMSCSDDGFLEVFEFDEKSTWGIFK